MSKEPKYFANIMMKVIFYQKIVFLNPFLKGVKQRYES